MARRGRFGRATTGSSNLSSFIGGLIKQSIEMNERALFNAFQDQTQYGGAVPTGADIESYVGSRLEGLDPNSAEYAYYVNLRETALRQERARNVNAAVDAFDASMGDNFNDMYDEISSLLASGDLSDAERREFEAVLTSKTADYIGIVNGQYANGSVSYEELLEKTDSAIGLLEGTVQENALVSRADAILDREGASLKTGQISADEYRSRSQAAFRGIDPNSPTTFDLNSKLFTNIWNSQVDEQVRKMTAVQEKGTGKRINRTEKYLDWARSQLDGLKASGVNGGDLYNTIMDSITSYSNTLSQLKEQAGNELYKSREAKAEQSRAVLDQFASQAAIYVSGAAGQSLKALTEGITLDELLEKDRFAMIRYFEINPSAQAEFNSALEEYRSDSKALVATAKAIGADPSDAMTMRNEARTIAEYSGQDTALEDYEDAYDKKVGLVGQAQGDDSVIEKINQEWLKFLKGQPTPSFGKGIAKSDVFQSLIDNEAVLYEYGNSGQEISNLGLTFLDVILPPSKDENKNTVLPTAAEAKNAALTTTNAQLLRDGKAAVYINAEGVGETIGLRQADQANGEFTFAEKNANGVVRTTIRQGVKVIGTSNGSEVEDSLWGYYYPDTKVWVERSTGDTFTIPPIKMRNGGAPEYDNNGNPIRITFDINPDKLDPKSKTGIVDAAAYPRTSAFDPRDPSRGGNPDGFIKVSKGAAVVGTMTWMSQTPAVINDNTKKAISSSFGDADKAEIEDQISIYNERVGRFDVGYGESRLTKETPSGSVQDGASLFDKFLGSGSTQNGKPSYASIIVQGAKPGTWVYKRVTYKDAYDEVRPGVFERKDSATAIGDPKTGALAPESQQFFPKTINVSGSLDSPKIKPYVASGAVTAPKSATPSIGDGAQNYFFRNSAVPSIANKDIAQARAGLVEPIKAALSPVSAQPLVDFRAGERAPLSGIVTPISITKPQTVGLGSPILASTAGDSTKERMGRVTGISAPSIPRVPSTPIGGSR